MSNTPIKIGYCLSLSGGLAANGQTARLAHQVWQERVNARGGLLGRDVELICVDDKSDATTVAGIYERLLSEEKADLLLGGYGNNSISPAMPLVIENEKFLVGLIREWTSAGQATVPGGALAEPGSPGPVIRRRLVAS